MPEPAESLRPRKEKTMDAIPVPQPGTTFLSYAATPAPVSCAAAASRWRRQPRR
jgi:hypothetical protein